MGFKEFEIAFDSIPDGSGSLFPTPEWARRTICSRAFDCACQKSRIATPSASEKPSAVPKVSVKYSFLLPKWWRATHFPATAERATAWGQVPSGWMARSSAQARMMRRFRISS